MEPASHRHQQGFLMGDRPAPIYLPLAEKKRADTLTSVTLWTFLMLLLSDLCLTLPPTMSGNDVIAVILDMLGAHQKKKWGQNRITHRIQLVFGTRLTQLRQKMERVADGTAIGGGVEHRLNHLHSKDTDRAGAYYAPRQNGACKNTIV